PSPSTIRPPDPRVSVAFTVRSLMIPVPAVILFAESDATFESVTVPSMSRWPFINPVVIVEALMIASPFVPHDTAADDGSPFVLPRNPEPSFKICARACDPLYQVIPVFRMSTRDPLAALCNRNVPVIVRLPVAALRLNVCVPPEFHA